MNNTTDATRKNQIDILEYGIGTDGTKRSSDRRLFMQLHVFSGCHNEQDIIKDIVSSELETVVYRDISDPVGLGVLFMSEDPTTFVAQARDLMRHGHFATLEHRAEYTMTGRSYASGYEPNLDDWLLQKPRRNARNPKWPWAVWYPLRRMGAFNALAENEQKSILREHGGIGRLYGEQNLVHDIRLACHGLDINDNEFVIGLVGKELYPISHLVQTMRKTRQTAEFIQTMGPFFIGYAIHQSSLV